MNRTLIRALLGAMLAISMLASSAGAWSVDTTDTDIEFLEQETFFGGGGPIGNLGTMTGDLVTWGVDEPTGTQPSYTVMNNYSTFTGERRSNTFTASGTFTGYLDTMAFDFYYDGPAKALCGLNALSFELYIDGRPYLLQDQASPSAGLSDTQDGDYGRTRWMFTRIFERMQDFEVEVGPDVEHTIEINIANFYACNEAVAVYDADVTPSGITFNLDPDTNAAKRYTEVDIYNPPPPLAS